MCLCACSSTVCNSVFSSSSTVCACSSSSSVCAWRSSSSVCGVCAWRSSTLQRFSPNICTATLLQDVPGVCVCLSTRERVRSRARMHARERVDISTLSERESVDTYLCHMASLQVCTEPNGA